jgi:mRNA-degrading endonuclease toxin of MazEF toxin-antitoxin module
MAIEYRRFLEQNYVLEITYKTGEKHYLTLTEDKIFQMLGIVNIDQIDTIKVEKLKVKIEKEKEKEKA